MSLPQPSLHLAAAASYLGMGGSTTFLINLAQALAETPHRLTIIGIHQSESPYVQEFAAAGADLQRVPAERLIYEDRLAAAYALLAKAQPRAVLACLGAESFELLRLTPPGVARIGVIQSHDPLPYELARQYAAELDAVVGVSPQIAEHLRTLPEFARTRVESIPYGIAFPSAVVRPERPAGAPLRVLYLGRIEEEQKRFSRMVQLIQLLAAEGAPIHFTIAGDGTCAKSAWQELRGLPNVTWEGAVEYTAVPALLQQHEVFILLSDYEGLPLSLLEAMGAGVVPVVSDLPSGMRQAMPPEGGCLVPVGDVAAAAQALRQLAAEPARLHAMSQVAQQHARATYSAARMAADYLHLVARITAGAAGASWPAAVPVPRPHGVRPKWLYQGVGRWLRRLNQRYFRR